MTVTRLPFATHDDRDHGRGAVTHALAPYAPAGRRFRRACCGRLVPPAHLRPAEQVTCPECRAFRAEELADTRTGAEVFGADEPGPATATLPPAETDLPPVTFTKLRDGSWGVRGPAAVLVEGARVTVQRRNGSRGAVRVGRVRWRGGAIAIATCTRG